MLNLNKILEPAKTIAIGGHVRPDGDCVGSCKAMYQYIQNNYPDNDINAKPLLQWRSHGNMLYANWLNYYVYQQTPYDYINTRKIVGK